MSDHLQDQPPPDLGFNPTAYVGKAPWKGYDFSPAFENNRDAVLHVCICDGCEEAKPRIKELAEQYRLSLFYKAKDGTIKPISELFEK